MKRLVIGVGNPGRGDDGAGLEVARRVRSAHALRRENGSYELIDLWEGADEVILVDAARSGSPAGTIHFIEANDETMPGGMLSTSTHSFGVAETVELARTLGRLPPRLLIYGIEVSDVTVGGLVSPEVERAIDELVEVIDGA
jgi:hydrogenase maturation protease